MRKLDQLREIAAFFAKYSLRTKKRIDAQRFAKVLTLMEDGRHLTIEGLKEIEEIALMMNTGNRPRLQALLDEDRVHS